MTLLVGQVNEPANNIMRAAAVSGGVLREAQSVLVRLAAAHITYVRGGTRYTDTLAAGAQASVWPAGSGTRFDPTSQTLVSFILPQNGGAATLYLTPESNLASVAAGTDIVPLDLVLRHRIRAYQPRPARLLGRRTYTIAQTTLGKGLSLWTGTPTGGSNTVTPPSGWETPGFDDSAWGPLYDEATGTSGSTAVATGGVWTSYPAPAGYLERILVRQPVTLPAGTVVGAQLFFSANDVTDGIWLGGTLLPHTDRSAETSGPWFPDAVTVPPTLLSGSTALLAASFQNQAGIGAGDAGGFFTLRVEMDVPGASPLSYADAVLADLPLAYWPLDEASGTSIHDASGNGHTGTASGTIAYSVAGPQAGSTALGFAGAESILVPASGAFPPAGAAPYTIEAWVAPTSTANIRAGVLSYGTHAAVRNFNALAIEGPSTGSFRAASRVHADWFGTVLNDALDHILSHAWHHVAVTYDGTTWTLYRDGAVVATSTPPAPSFVSTDVLIGVANVAAGEYFVGALAHVALYDYAVSAARILAHYNAG